MRYLKTYEEINKNYNYNVGDTVVCVETVNGLPLLHNREKEEFNPALIDLIKKGERYIVKDIKNDKVDVVNIETGKETINWYPNNFISEEEYNAKKFNI